MENNYKLEPIIIVSKTYEFLPNNKGYLTTHVTFDRELNVIIGTNYHYHHKYNCPENDILKFDNYQTFKQYLESLY